MSREEKALSECAELVALWRALPESDRNGIAGFLFGYLGESPRLDGVRFRRAVRSYLSLLQRVSKEGGAS